MLADRPLLHVLHGATSIAVQTARLLARMMTHVRQALCGLLGHDLELRRERRRLSLHCRKCGWNSRGWTIGTREHPTDDGNNHGHEPFTAPSRL